MMNFPFMLGHYRFCFFTLHVEVGFIIYEFVANEKRNHHTLAVNGVWDFRVENLRLVVLKWEGLRIPWSQYRFGGPTLRSWRFTQFLIMP